MTGKLPLLRHVEGLVHQALVERAVAKEGDGDAIFAANLGGQRHARCVRHLRADDAVGAHQSPATGRESASSRPCPWQSRRLAQHLADRPLGIHAARQRMVMAAIGAGQIVVLAQRGGHADRRAFVPNRRVHGAADLAGFGQLEQRLLDAADQKHHAVHGEQLFGGEDERSAPLPPLCAEGTLALREGSAIFKLLYRFSCWKPQFSDCVWNADC
jgi:hypothetical protein